MRCIALKCKPLYEGKFRLLVEPVAAQSKLAGMYENPGANANPQEEILDYNTQILVLQSPEIIDPILKQISSRYPDISYPSLVENLKISRLQETKILEVSYQDAEPQKIQFSLQQLAKAYLKYSLQQRQVNLGQGIQFVDSEMPKLRMRVNSLQTQLQRFRQHYNFIDPEAKAERLSSEVSSIQFQRLDTQKQLAETRKLYAILQGKSGTELAQSGTLGATTPAGSGTDVAHGAFDATTPAGSGTQSAETPAFDRASQSRSDAQLAKTHDGSSQGRSGAAQAQNEGSVYQGLVTRLRDLDSQIATELSRYRENSPAIQVLRLKRKNLLPVLQQEAKRVLGIKLVEVANQISGLEVRSVKIAQAESSLNQQIKQLPNLARQYTDLQRELKVATQSLNQFLEKRESLQIENAQKQIPWQLLSSPELPQIPFSPNVQRNLILGVITGLLGGMAAALCVERLDIAFPDRVRYNKSR